MKKDAFFIYLSTVYRGVRSKRLLTNKAISDLCSRCEKLEKYIQIDIDETFDGTDDSVMYIYGKFGKKCKKRDVKYYDMRTALHRYFDFLRYEINNPSKKNLSFSKKAIHATE